MNLKSITLITMFVFLVFTNSYVPNTRKPHGLLFGSTAADIQVQLIYDAQCDGSYQMNQIVKQAKITLGNLKDQKISFRYFFTALPYHINSFKMSRGLQYIMDKHTSEVAYGYIQYCLSNIDKWSSNSLENTTLVEFEKKFSAEVASNFGVNQSAFYHAIKHYSNYDTSARATWKYLQGMRSISGTPHVYINGVFQDGAEEWGINEWVNNLKALL